MTEKIKPFLNKIWPKSWLHMLQNKGYSLVSWPLQGGYIVWLDPKLLNIDTYMNQFVNEQLFRYMQHVLKPLHLNCNLLKFKGVKDSQLDQRIQEIPQCKPIKKMADSLNIFNLCAQQLICTIT